MALALNAWLSLNVIVVLDRKKATAHNGYCGALGLLNFFFLFFYKVNGLKVFRTVKN